MADVVPSGPPAREEGCCWLPIARAVSPQDLPFSGSKRRAGGASASRRGGGTHSPSFCALAEETLPCINLHMTWQNVCLCHFCKSSSRLCCLHIVAVIEVLEL